MCLQIQSLAALQLCNQRAPSRVGNIGQVTSQVLGTSGSHLSRKISIRHQWLGPMERGSVFLKHLQTRQSF